MRAVKWGLVLGLVFATAAWAKITDEEYVQYQVEVQTVLYKYAQDPTQMMAAMKPIQDKYKPDSEEWQEYYKGLQEDPTRFLKLHSQIEEALKKNGVQWEKQE